MQKKKTTMVTKLSELISDYKSAHKISQTKLETVSFRYRPGIEMKVNQAKTTAKLKMEQIDKHLFPSRVIAVLGTGDKEVLEEVQLFMDYEGGVVVDYNLLYERLTDYCEKIMPKDRTFGMGPYSLLIDKTQEVADLFNIPFGDLEDFKPLRCSERKDTLNYIKNTLNTPKNFHLNLAVLKEQILKTIIDKPIVSKTVPCLILNVEKPDLNNINKLCSKAKFYEFKKPFEVSEETIVELFKSI